MAQMTWRATGDLLERVRRQAAANGRSMNEWVTLVMAAASDPDLETDEAVRIRQRLLHAGVLADPSGEERRRPDEGLVAGARKKAGNGTPLSDIVTGDRR